MKSSLGKVLSYMGSFFIGIGVLVGVPMLGIFWLGSLIIVTGIVFGLILLGIARVIGLQEEILAAVSGGTGTSDTPAGKGNGIPRTEG